MLRARPLSPSDLVHRVEWFNTPEIYRQMPLDPPFSLAATQKWFAGTLHNERRRDFAFETDGGTGEGLAVRAMGGLVEIDYRNQRGELYVLVDPAITGKGVGRRVVSWMCRFAFRRLNLQRVYLFTLAENEDARRFYERLGFVGEGVMRKHFFHNGQFVDRHIHGLLRDAWVEADQSWHTDFSFDVA